MRYGYLFYKNMYVTEKPKDEDECLSSSGQGRKWNWDGAFKSSVILIFYFLKQQQQTDLRQMGHTYACTEAIWKLLLFWSKSSHFIQTLLFSVQEAGSLKKILGKLWVSLWLTFVSSNKEENQVTLNQRCALRIAPGDRKDKVMFSPFWCGVRRGSQGFKMAYFWDRDECAHHSLLCGFPAACGEKPSAPKARKLKQSPPQWT